MYGALEAILLKYLKEELIQTQAQAQGTSSEPPLREKEGTCSEPSAAEGFKETFKEMVSSDDGTTVRQNIKENSPDDEITEEEGEKPLVIAISDSSEKLRKIKALVGNEGKGVFVRDFESASKYLAKNMNK